MNNNLNSNVLHQAQTHQFNYSRIEYRSTFWEISMSTLVYRHLANRIHIFFCSLTRHGKTRLSLISSSILFGFLYLWIWNPFLLLYYSAVMKVSFVSTDTVPVFCTNEKEKIKSKKPQFKINENYKENVLNQSMSVLQTKVKLLKTTSRNLGCGFKMD